MQQHKTHRVNTGLVAETLAVFCGISVLAVWVHRLPVASVGQGILYAPLLMFQGLWFYRFYIVGHEASHGKLFPQRKGVNDFWGSVILLPLLAPLRIYRKIHQFHHGFNRKDHHTSALDTFVTRSKPSWYVRWYYQALWYVSVFMGGFFLHSLISVLLFLFVPVSLSEKISPAFKNWRWTDQIHSIAMFLLGVGFHFSVYRIGGSAVYRYTLGYPMLAFAWWLSLLVYVFHYDTTVGDSVRYNVRSLNRIPVFSWVLMNFNEHATHHQYPNIPWYELPVKRTPLPADFASHNQNTYSFWRAILNQLKGPTIVHQHDHTNSET